MYTKQLEVNSKADHLTVNELIKRKSTALYFPSRFEPIKRKTKQGFKRLKEMVNPKKVIKICQNSSAIFLRRFESIETRTNMKTLPNAKHFQSILFVYDTVSQ